MWCHILLVLLRSVISVLMSGGSGGPSDFNLVIGVVFLNASWMFSVNLLISCSMSFGPLI